MKIFGNLDVENFLKLSLPWNSWVRTVISLRISCSVWNLSCVKLYMPANVMKLVIQLEATSEKQLQLYNQLLGVLLETHHFQIGISRLTVSWSQLDCICLWILNKLRYNWDILEVKNLKLFWPECLNLLK